MLLVGLMTVTAIAHAGSDPAHIIMTLTGPAPGAYFGWSAAPAGDVNGDGFPDILVGAPGSGAAGRVFVFHGGPGADDVPDLVLEGTTAGERFGTSVASAGDMNGDGYPDILVGAPRNSLFGDDTGRAYLYFGGPNADDVADLVVDGPAPYMSFGYSVASAGDVDGDGFDEIIVGSSRFQTTHATTQAGFAILYWGGSTVSRFNKLVLAGRPASDVYFGHSVASAGDLNHDGFGDLAVMANSFTATNSSVSHAYVYLGGPRSSAGGIATADFVLSDPGEGSGYWNFWNSVAPAGDVNGDGFDDLVVGAYGGADSPGHVFVFFGGSTFDDGVDLLFTGPGGSYLFGLQVAPVGDTNGDGYADILVGDPQYGAGMAYLYSGGPTADTVPKLRLTGLTPGDLYGTAVASAGDLDHDGFDDLLIGAPGNDEGGEWAGRVYVLSLHTTPLAANLKVSPSTINLASHAPSVTATIEIPGVDPASIDVSTVRLQSVLPPQLKFAQVGDEDADGLPDLMLKFSRAPLDPLLTTGQNHLEVTGSLITGETFRGTCDVRVLSAGGGRLAASLAPNPLNPSAILRFSTTRFGQASVELFDIHGRLVAAPLNKAQLPAGDHEVAINGRDRRGVPLASGVYYYRIEAEGESSTGRLVVAK